MYDPRFIALAIISLGFLIVVHEGGHYFVARWCKMRIERFSIGFGPAILKRTSKTTGTTFQLAPIPFGGFVEIRGMNIAEEIDPEDHHAYPNRPTWQRFLTIFAGPATNYLSAIVLALLLYNCHGVDTPHWYAVGEVREGYDAHSKLKHGDRITAIDGVPLFIDSGTSLIERVVGKKGAALRVTVERDGAAQDFTISPTLDNAETPRIQENFAKIAQLAPQFAPTAEWLGKLYPAPVWRIGVVPEVQYLTTSVGVLEAGRRALEYPVLQTEAIGSALYGIAFRHEAADPGGPVRMVQEFYRAFSAGIVPGIKLVMMLSVYLGLFNLLPIPALDGGRLVFLAYEMVTRRRANPKVEMMVHMAGIMALGVLMIFVFVIDIQRLF